MANIVLTAVNDFTCGTANKVRAATPDGENVSRAVVCLFNAWWDAEDNLGKFCESEAQASALHARALLTYDPVADCILVQGGEGFTLSDFADAVRTALAWCSNVGASTDG